MGAKQEGFEKSQTFTEKSNSKEILEGKNPSKKKKRKYRF